MHQPKDEQGRQCESSSLDSHELSLWDMIARGLSALAEKMHIYLSVSARHLPRMPSSAFWVGMGVSIRFLGLGIFFFSFLQSMKYRCAMIISLLPVQDANTVRKVSYPPWWMGRGVPNQGQNYYQCCQKSQRYNPC